MLIHRCQNHFLTKGGYYVESFRSDLPIICDKKERIASTAIYFLICPGNISRLHRIQSDEVWHFYLGGPMTVIELDNSVENGYRATILGQNALRGELVQYTVKAGNEDIELREPSTQGPIFFSHMLCISVQRCLVWFLPK